VESLLKVSHPLPGNDAKVRELLDQSLRGNHMGLNTRREPDGIYFSYNVAVVVAHVGTQQFFCDRTPGHVVLRNMIARLTLKGSYRWNWSITTGSSFTAAESYRFAEASRGAIVQAGAGLQKKSGSWVSVNDQAIVIFRLAADSQRLTVWLLNYSDEHKQVDLSFTVPLRACRRVNLEGKPMTGASAVLDESGNRVKFDLSPWEMAAIDLERG